jgi:hypothetical protein
VLGRSAARGARRLLDDRWRPVKSETRGCCRRWHPRSFTPDSTTRPTPRSGISFLDPCVYSAGRTRGRPGETIASDSWRSAESTAAEGYVSARPGRRIEGLLIALINVDGRFSLPGTRLQPSDSCGHAQRRQQSSTTIDRMPIAREGIDHAWATLQPQLARPGLSRPLPVQRDYPAAAMAPTS